MIDTRNFQNERWSYHCAEGGSLRVLDVQNENLYYVEELPAR